MQYKKLVTVLVFLLAAACIIVALNLVSVIRNAEYLPDASLNDCVTLLEQARIHVDPAILSAKREQGTVYVCDSADYNTTVAELIGESAVREDYIIPDGEIFILENGSRIEFGRNFSFRYARGGVFTDSDTAFDLSQTADHVSEEKAGEIAAIVTEFLDRGSREFETREHQGQMEIQTVVGYIWESAGTYYAQCSRTIDGIGITENTILCLVKGGTVSEAYGSWSFLTPGESYSAQLSDLLNILFTVKKEIGDAVPDDGGVTITDIRLCYSLYFYGGEESFALIPCWQITTDRMGKRIYNAIDGTFYTNEKG